MKLLRYSGVLLTAVALFVVFPDTATAAPSPSASLTLTLTTADRPLTAASLTCDPPGGSHPQAIRACDELASVDGDLARLPEQQLICTMEFAPVTAVASGEWNGQTIEWEKEFGNACSLRAATGSVFAIDQAGVTPPVR